MSALADTDLSHLRDHFVRLRGNPEHVPDASIIIPVNARSDLEWVRKPIGDIIRYAGKYTVELVLVINNYPPDVPPAEIDDFRDLGTQVVAAPSARRPGEAVVISARALGVRAAKSNVTIHFDADCRIPDIQALLDWYVETLNSGAQLAYTHVGFHELRPLLSVYAKIVIHHTTRWVKRNFLGVPTARGSNYAIGRSLFLQLYEAGKLCHDIQIGMTVKLAKKRIVYSGRPSLTVLTSGREFRGGWIKLLRFIRYRLRYNLKGIPIQEEEAKRWETFDRVSDRWERDAVTKEKEAPLPGGDHS